MSEKIITIVYLFLFSAAASSIVAKALDCYDKNHSYSCIHADGGTTTFQQAGKDRPEGN